MGFQYGSGTATDPYLITNSADVKLFVDSYISSGKYFALVQNVDGSSAVATAKWIDWSFYLDGRGFSLSISINKGDVSTLIKTITGCEIKNTTLSLLLFGGFSNFASITSNGRIKLQNSSFSINLSLTCSVVVFSGANGLLIGGNLTVDSSATGIYKHGSVIANTINTTSFPDGNPYGMSNYSGFDEKYWIFDGVSLPRSRPQSTADITTRQCVKGKTYIGGVGKKRSICFFTASNGYRYKQMTSDFDGGYLANLNDVVEPVIVMHYDDPGVSFAPSKSYVLGERIHPPTPNGYVYVCTTDGIASSTAPAEWPTSGTLTSGAAIFTATPIYAPASHLAVPSPVNIITGEPA